MITLASCPSAKKMTHLAAVQKLKAICAGKVATQRLGNILNWLVTIPAMQVFAHADCYSS